MAADTPAAAAYTFESVTIGDSFSIERSFTREDVLQFAALSGDFSPLHVDEAYAATTEFGGCVVHGMLLASLFSQLVGMHMPGRHALYLAQDLTFRKPVLVDEHVRATGKVVAKNEPTNSIVLATDIRDKDGKVAVSGTARVKIRDARERGSSALVTPTDTGTTHKVALVTGGSRGIGAEIARELSRRGYFVAVNYHRNAERARAVVDEIVAAGGSAIAIPADVRDPSAVSTLFETIAREIGPVSVLVNGALGNLTPQPFADLTWEDFLAQLEYQVKACILTIRAAQMHMKTIGGGSVINILSQVTGGVPPSGMADYVTGKCALEGLSKALAVELATDGIRINMISPGLVQTELTQFHPDRVFKMEALRTPLRRVARPADVARAVAFLAGDDSAFVTGVNLFVTGGQVMP